MGEVFYGQSPTPTHDESKISVVAALAAFNHSDGSAKCRPRHLFPCDKTQLLIQNISI